MNTKIFDGSTPFERFGIMLDCSRNGVMTLRAIKRMINLMERMDYNTLMLYTEDTYEVANQPYFGRYRGRYTKAELKELDEYAKAHGIELMPCIQTLAHLFTLQHWPVYWNHADYREILMVGDEKVYRLIDDMFASLSECYTSRLVNVGMDEARFLGLGKYLEQHGYRNRVEILCEHLNRVSEIAKKYGFELCMWSDMFFKLATKSGNWTEGSCDEIDASVGAMIPDNVRLIYWDYYSTEKEHYDQWLDGHEKLKSGCLFAGGLWTWTGFAPHNAYSIQCGIPATKSCFEHKIKDVFYTVWGNDGMESSRFSILPAMFYNACIAHGIRDEAEIKRSFEEVVGIAFDNYMLLDLPNTVNAEGEHANPEKYMLYCDILMGKFDSNVREEDAAGYARMAERLEPQTVHPEYGFLFTTMKTLCEVLAVKYDLGVRTRMAYFAKDGKQELQHLLADYDELAVRTERFYRAFREQWLWENKPQGFEVHDARLGGLLQRIRHCRKRILDYIEEREGCIAELEEDVLDFEGRDMEAANNEPRVLEYNSWAMVVTSGVV